jgi:hypothetical protein
MKPPQDPPRLLDPGSDAPAWLRSPLEAGARDVAGPARLARIAAGLPSGPPGPGTSNPPDPPRAGPSHPQPPVAPVVPSVFSGAAIGAALGLAVVGAGWVASPRAADVVPSPRPAPSAVVTLTAPEPVRPLPTEAPAPRPRTPPERAEPRSSGTAGPAASVGIEPAGPASSSEPDPAAGESERSILQRAQDALRGSPAQALALTDLHLARYPGGVLAQEREVLAIAALVGMGRAVEARARATRFVASFPNSAHRRRLEVLIPDLESSAGVHKDPGAPPSTP